jgi:hypothetical protein
MDTPKPVEWIVSSKDDCGVWSVQKGMTQFLTKLREDRLWAWPASEDALQYGLVRACTELALNGTTYPNFIEVLEVLLLKNLHDEKPWNQRECFQVYHKQLEATASKEHIDISTPSSNPDRASTTSSQAQGPMKPDGMIALRTGAFQHPSLVFEAKYVPAQSRRNDKFWQGKHKEGLAQTLWYLYATNETCHTRLAFVLVNNRFQRIVVSKDANDQRIFLLEVPGTKENQDKQNEQNEQHEQNEQKEVSNDGDFLNTVLHVDKGLPETILGEKHLPNLLPSDPSKFAQEAKPGHSTYRLWRFLSAGIMVAETWYDEGRCRGECDPVIQDVTPEARTVLPMAAEEIGGVASQTTAFEKTMADLRQNHSHDNSAIIEAWMPHPASGKVVQEEEQHPMSAQPDFQNDGEAPFEQPAAPPDFQHGGETHSKQDYDDELGSATCAEEYSHPPVEVDAILKTLGSLGVSLQLTSSEQMDAVVEEVIAGHGA